MSYPLLEFLGIYSVHFLVFLGNKNYPVFCILLLNFQNPLSQYPAQVESFLHVDNSSILTGQMVLCNTWPRKVRFIGRSFQFWCELPSHESKLKVLGITGGSEEWVNPLAPNPVRGKLGGSPASRSIHEVAAIFVPKPMQHQTRRLLVKIHLGKILVLIVLNLLVFHQWDGAQ